MFGWTYVFNKGVVRELRGGYKYLYYGYCI